MDEILQQILSELKDIKTNQAVLEREVRKNTEKTSDIRIFQHTYDQNMARVEQGINRLQDDMCEMKEELGEIHQGMNAIVEWVDKIDQKQKAI